MKRLLLGGVLLGLAIAMVPFMYFLYHALDGKWSLSEILKYGKYVALSMVAGMALMLFCAHKISGNSFKKITIRNGGE